MVILWLLVSSMVLLAYHFLVHPGNIVGASLIIGRTRFVTFGQSLIALSRFGVNIDAVEVRPG